MTIVERISISVKDAVTLWFLVSADAVVSEYPSPAQDAFDRSLSPKRGNVDVAILDGILTVECLVLAPSGVILRAEDS